MNPGELLTAMVTPLNQEGELHLKMVAPLVKHLMDSCDGLVVLGTTGESPTLSSREKVLLVEEVLRVREELGKDFPVIVGTGSYCTRESIALSRKMEDFKIQGLMLVTPYYNKPTQEGLVQHFTSIAQETSLPVILYNVPSRTGCNLEAKTTINLSQLENIIAIKEASGDLDQVVSICKGTPPDFLIYSGDDKMTLPILSIGGHGVISVASHLVGAKIREMIKSFQRGLVEKAKQIHLELMPLFLGLFTTTNPIPVKEALKLIGLKVGPPRIPLTALGGKERRELALLLTSLDLISLSRDEK